MRGRRHRGVFLVTAAAVAGVLASGMLQAVPGVAEAAAAPAVTGVSPSVGPLAGGTSVTITGTEFTGATGVDFGSMPAAASSVTVNGDTSITVTAPAMTVAGLIDVTVTTPAGTSATNGVDQYLYSDVFSYPPAGTAGVDNIGPNVGAVDQSGTPIDIPYYVKDGNSYRWDSADDGAGLFGLAVHPYELDSVPKDQWVQYAGGGIVNNTFIGDASCGSEPWPFHTMSYAIDPSCWRIGMDAATCGSSSCLGIWDVQVPVMVTDTAGQTLVFDHWSGTADTSHCDTGDQGYVENWPGAGESSPGVPGAFMAGEQFNPWGPGSFVAHYVPRSAGTTAPLIELDAPFDCQWYAQNQVMAPRFSCVDLDGSGVKSCAATAGVTAEGDLDTSTPGAHTVTITATDNNGSTRTMTQRYFVGQPPTLTMDPDPSAPSSTGWYNASQLGEGNSLPVTVTIGPNPSTDSIDTASCTLDGGQIWSFASGMTDPNNPVVVPQTFTDPGTQTIQIGQGTHTLSCTTTDLSGQTTTQSQTYQVDTNSPQQAGFVLPVQVTGTNVPNFTCPGVPEENGAQPPATYTVGQKVSLEWAFPDSDGPHGSGIVSPAVTSTTNGWATGYTTLDTSKVGLQQTPAPDTVDAAGNVTPGEECPYYVVAATSSTSVASSENPSGYGDSVTFTATVSSTDGGGSVAFYADGSPTAISGCGNQSLTAGSGGGYTATCTTSALAVGAHTVLASYSGDSGALASSATLAGGQTVNQGSTTTSVASSDDPSAYGQAVRLTATVSATDGGGSVAFYADGPASPVTLCSAALLAPGSGGSYTASCNVSNLPAGTHAVSASYAGDANYLPSTGGLAGGQVVNPAPLTITASSGTMIYGSTPPAITPSYSGFVNGDGPGSLATAPSCSTAATPASPAGTYASNCTGAAASNYAISYVSGAVTVAPAATTLAYTGPGSASAGASLIPAAALTSAAAACQASQPVSFTLNANPTTGAAGSYSLESAATTGSGTATGAPVPTTGWQPGVYTLTASYAGTGSCNAATATASLLITAPGLAAAGAGKYTIPAAGPVSFSFVVTNIPHTSRYVGGITVTSPGAWQLTGTLATYLKTGTGQGTVTGTGTLSWWNPALNNHRGGWQLAAKGVAFTASFTATTRTAPGAFGIKISYTPVPPQPATLPNSAPLTLQSGLIAMA